MKLNLSRTLSLSLLTIVILFSCYRIVHGGLASNFTLTDIDGNSFSLIDFRGKVVILNFFSSRCGPCQTEMSHLKAVQNEFGTKLTIISLSIRLSYDTDEMLRQFRDDHDITWIVARDTANVRGKYDVPAIPTLYIIDEEGYIRYHHVGLTDGSIIRGEIGEIIPTLKTDLNKDGTINILDISIVAKAFGSAPEDPNWNMMGDLNNDEIINIVDVSIIAMDYGKTV